MKRIVFDSYAIIAFFREESGFEIVRDLFLQMSQNKIDGYMTSINVGEMYYMISRKSSTIQANSALNAILQLPLDIVNADLSLSIEAAKIKSSFSLSYADAFAAALTISKKATLITGDKEFDLLISQKDFKVAYI